MPTPKGFDRERFRKLAASMDSPSRSEAINAFSLALDELAKQQNARFSDEYESGKINGEDAEEAEQEMSRLRAELNEAFESASRDETTIKQLEESIDLLHARMEDVDKHLEANQVPPVPPTPIKEIQRTPDTLPPQTFDWGNGEPFTEDITQRSLALPSPRHLFSWSTLGTWAYGSAVVFWLMMVCLPNFRNAERPLFLPLLCVVIGVPLFVYFRKLRESHGWLGVAVKVFLSVEILTVLGALFVWAVEFHMLALTTREKVFAFAVYMGVMLFLYSERFFLWVLDDQKRTQLVVFPGAALVLLSVVTWVTFTDGRIVKEDAPSQLAQPPHVRKPHHSPKPTPPPNDPPHVLEYEFVFPDRSAPSLLETSYSPVVDRPYLVAAAFQTSTPSGFLSDGVVLFLLACVALFVFKLLSNRETEAQRRKDYQKALREANAPLAHNETGNAGHASPKDLKSRGWS